jgi:2-amino-4-hydroxy-6-hydroxymethyldihydropteridine diphosphokinase
MTPIPKPNVRMTPAATPSHPPAPEPVTPHAGTAVVLALGSNLGDRAGTLHAAVRSIADIAGFELGEVSPLVESVAVKPAGMDPDAPAYLNTVLTGRYTGEPHALLAEINRIEADHGRQRAERWGDRTLDIDIIAFGDLRISDDHLTIPHPRAAERDFVLVPWLAIDADAVLPGRGAVADLLAAAGSTLEPRAGEQHAGEQRAAEPRAAQPPRTPNPLTGGPTNGADR